MNAAQTEDVHEKNLLRSEQDLKLERRTTFQLENDLMHAAKTTAEWPTQVCDCPRVAQPKPRLGPQRTSAEGPEDGRSDTSVKSEGA